MDDDQQFCLRWNNHQSTLISVFDTLLENETLVDCTLAAEGKFLKAHKVVLSACSPYFATLLQEQYDKHPIFILKDVKYQELRAMMDYMYRGEVNISQDQLAALLKAAESLQIKGLSDNRTGSSGNVPKQPEHHRGGLGVPGGVGAGAGKMGSGYTLEQTKRARIGPSSMDAQEMSGSREGSSSPSRRRRKVRRRSIENAMTDVHDNSNSSQQIQANQSSSILQQSNANLAGVGAITAAASALATHSLTAATLPSGSSTSAGTLTGVGAAISTAGTTQQQLTTSVTKKTETVKGTSDAMNTENVQAGAAVGDEPDMEHVKSEKQNHKQQKAPGAAAAAIAGGKDPSTDLVIEPKSEYDDEGNEETVEDLTLDDEDMGMDDLDHNAGTSQGGEGSSQGYAPWQHERSQEELLLATQEAQQRDPQALMKLEFQQTMVVDGETMNQRFYCPVCGKSYLRKRHLQRHMRDECIGIPPRFSCEMCPSRFRRKYHMVRHLISKHGVPSHVAQQTTGNRNVSMDNKNGINVAGVIVNAAAAAGGSSGEGCNSSVGSAGSHNGNNSPIPENLSMKKENFENDYVMANAVHDAAAAAGGGDTMVTTAQHAAMALNVTIPTYGLTGAITAISAAAAAIEDYEGGGSGGVIKRTSPILAEDVCVGNNETTGAVAGATGFAAIKTEPGLAVNKGMNIMDDDWKMKLSLQLISNSLLKERLMNTMPFAYNNTN